MTGVPDNRLWRRVAALERQVDQLQQMFRVMAQTRGTTPLTSRLWRAKLNEAFGATTALSATADLLTIDGTDTDLDITLYDPLEVFAEWAADDELYVLEQIDMDGTRRFVPMQSPCP